MFLANPELYGRRWYVANGVYGPQASAARSILMSNYYPDGTEQLQGTLVTGGQRWQGWSSAIRRTSNHHQTCACGHRGAPAGTSLDFVLVNVATGEVIPLSTIAATALASSSSPRSWTVQFTVDANNTPNGWKVTIDGTTATAPDQYTADAAAQVLRRPWRWVGRLWLLGPPAASR
jgi:hypothetical protein